MSQSDQPKPAPTEAEIAAIVKRAGRGDESCLPEVRSRLDAVPALDRANGDPVRHLIDRILAAYSKHLLVQESVRHRLKEVRARLEGEAPTPLGLCS